MSGAGKVTSIPKPEPLTGDAAIAAGSNWRLSDEARRDVQAIGDNVRAALAMAPFIRVGGVDA